MARSPLHPPPHPPHTAPQHLTSHISLLTPSPRRSSSGGHDSVPIYQSTSHYPSAATSLPRSPRTLLENAQGAVEFSDLISNLSGCSWFFIILLFLLLIGPMFSQGYQGTAVALFIEQPFCNLLRFFFEGFIITMMLLTPTIALIKEYSSTPVHREIGINSVVQ
jgi:hypothetical protein